LFQLIEIAGGNLCYSKKLVFLVINERQRIERYGKVKNYMLLKLEIV
jgi:hypothetical protein